MTREHGVAVTVVVVSEGVCGREWEPGNLWVGEPGEDGRLCDDGDLEGDAEVVVEEDVRDLGLRDVGVDSGHGICERRLLKDLFPELGEGGACTERSSLAICPKCPGIPGEPSALGILGEFNALGILGKFNGPP